MIEVDLPLPRRQGKVRDVFTLPPHPATHTERLLIVASDRISAFDVVMPTPIIGKGRLLTRVSQGWFAKIEGARLVRTHVLGHDPQPLVAEGILTPQQATALQGRVVIAQRCRVVPVECVARGYLDGSGWLEYQSSGAVCGVAIPPGLKRGDRLPAPVFTPATKEDAGRHDQNIDFERAVTAAQHWLDEQRAAGAAIPVAPRALMERLRDLTLAIYHLAATYAAPRGLILADTKFEFGFAPGATEPILVDEALTPDSSRYWDAAKWAPGGEQPSFDKQFLREYLNTLVAHGNWNKQAPGPALPPAVVAGTLERYQEVEHRLFPQHMPHPRPDDSSV